MPSSIDANLTVAELLADSPRAVRVFLDRNLACVGCTMARFDTLADVARIYRLDLAELIAAVSDEAVDAEGGRSVAATPGAGLTVEREGGADVHGQCHRHPGPLLAGEGPGTPSRRGEER